jgi:hypothetical protein
MRHFALLLASLLSAAAAAAPGVDAPHIYGIHTWNNTGANSLLNGKSGWTVELMHANPNPPFFDLTHAQAQQIVAEGWTLVIRIDYDPYTGQTLPENSSQRTAYNASCEAIVAQFSDVCHTWIIGNEFNAAFGVGGANATTVALAEQAYREARDAIHSAQPEAIVLVGAIAPWNASTTGTGPYASNRQWLNYFYDLVHRLDDTADGFAIHAYGGRSGDTDPRNDDEMAFGVYERWMEIIESNPATMWKPVYLTEMNHAADGDSNGDGFPNNSYDAGFIQRAFEEIGTWNEAHVHRIRCACWFAYANGGFPGYNITTYSQMADDFRASTSGTNYIGAPYTGIGEHLWELWR